MGKGYVIRDYAEYDSYYLAVHMRQSDRDELTAAHGEDVDIQKVLAQAAAMSTICRVWAHPGGKLMAMFGMAEHPTYPGAGIPWVLATDDVKDFTKTFIKDGLKILDEMHTITPFLINYVDVRNESSIKYIRRLGFDLHPPVPFGKQGKPFYPFDKMKGIHSEDALPYVVIDNPSEINRV